MSSYLSNDERTPLLNTERENNQISCYSSRCFLLSFCSFLLCTLVFIVIVSAISSSHNADFDLQTDIPQIPFAYSLRKKGQWFPEYVVETLPSEFNRAPTIKGVNDSNSDIQETTKIAEIATKFLSKGVYQIKEFRYNPDGNVTTVLTAFSEYEGFWFADILVSFTEKDNESLRPLDPEACDYKITWCWSVEGHVSRRCPRAGEEEFYKVAYFKGYASGGLKFISVNQMVEYGEVSRMSQWWNVKDVVIDQRAPFPPILPAICSVYYDSFHRSGDVWNSIYRDDEGVKFE